MQFTLEQVAGTWPWLWECSRESCIKNRKSTREKERSLCGLTLLVSLFPGCIAASLFGSWTIQPEVTRGTFCHFLLDGERKAKATTSRGKREETTFSDMGHPFPWTQKSVNCFWWLRGAEGSCERCSEVPWFFWSLLLIQILQGKILALKMDSHPPRVLPKFWSSK